MSEHVLTNIENVKIDIIFNSNSDYYKLTISYKKK